MRISNLGLQEDYGKTKWRNSNNTKRESKKKSENGLKKPIQTILLHLDCGDVERHDIIQLVDFGLNGGAVR